MVNTMLRAVRGGLVQVGQRALGKKCTSQFFLNRLSVRGSQRQVGNENTLVSDKRAVVALRTARPPLGRAYVYASAIFLQRLAARR